MESKPVYTETPLSFVEKRQETENVFTYVFKPEAPVSYEAADYGHVRLFGMPEWVRAVREFSFASAPHETYIAFGIQVRRESEYQQRLTTLRMGDRVGLFKIKHHMTWPPPTSEAVMIAGGVGITPFRAMLLDAHYKKLPLRAHVLHIASHEFPYENDMRLFAVEYQQARRESLLSALSLLADTHSHMHFYVAGSPGFTETVQNALSVRGIHSESDSFKGLQNDF